MTHRNQFMSLLLNRFAFVWALLVFAGVQAFSQTQAPGNTIVGYTQVMSKAFDLPDKVNETSGIIYYDGGIWTFNDSGGKPELYKIDPAKGNILKTVVIRNAVNKDWEDIAQDEDHIYIGDFGNNMGNRKDLGVYKIAKADIAENALVSVDAESILFSYADQLEYRERNRKHDFDCEAMISFDDHLILFSKNWLNGNTRMYKLSKEPGKYKIKPVDEFEAEGLITGADYDGGSHTLVLIGYVLRYPFLYVFNDFDGTHLLSSSPYRVDFTTMGQIQTEGVCFTGSGRLAISAERTKHENQSLYTTDLPLPMGGTGQKP